MSIETITPQVAYQLGVLRGARRDDGSRRFSDEEIDAFAALMATEPPVRPKPRSTRPRHVLHYPTDLRGDEPHTTASPRPQPQPTTPEVPDDRHDRPVSRR